jgi:hypothetical protein
MLDKDDESEIVYKRDRSGLIDTDERSGII